MSPDQTYIIDSGGHGFIVHNKGDTIAIPQAFNGGAIIGTVQQPGGSAGSVVIGAINISGGSQSPQAIASAVMNEINRRVSGARRAGIGYVGR